MMQTFATPLVSSNQNINLLQAPPRIQESAHLPALRYGSEIENFEDSESVALQELAMPLLPPAIVNSARHPSTMRHKYMQSSDSLHRVHLVPEGASLKGATTRGRWADLMITVDDGLSGESDIFSFSANGRISERALRVFTGGVAQFIKNCAAQSATGNPNSAHPDHSALGGRALIKSILSDIKRADICDDLKKICIKDVKHNRLPESDDIVMFLGADSHTMSMLLASAAMPCIIRASEKPDLVLFDLSFSFDLFAARYGWTAAHYKHFVQSLVNFCAETLPRPELPSGKALTETLLHALPRRIAESIPESCIEALSVAE